MEILPNYLISIKQRNKPKSNYCIASFSDGSEIELTVDLAMKYKLEANREIFPTEFLHIVEEQRIVDCKQVAYNFASYSPRSKKQIINRLKNNGFTESEIDNAISFLQDFKLSDDYEYSRKYIKYYLLKKYISEYKMKKILIEKGVEKEIADKAVNDFFPKEKLDDMIRSATIKKLRTLKKDSKAVKKVKLFYFLQHRGFPNDMIKKTVEEIVD